MNQILVKFLKGALTGGLSAIVAALAVGVKIQSIDDLKGLLTLLGVAFLSGAIHAIVELLKPTLPATTSSVVTTVAQKASTNLTADSVTPPVV